MDAYTAAYLFLRRFHYREAIPYDEKCSDCPKDDNMFRHMGYKTGDIHRKNLSHICKLHGIDLQEALDCFALLSLEDPNSLEQQKAGLKTYQWDKEIEK